MEPEVSFLCLQKPLTGPYPKPDKSSPQISKNRELSRVLLKELIITQLAKNFPIFCGTLRFITVFTTARHWSDESSPQLSKKHSQGADVFRSIPLLPDGIS